MFAIILMMVLTIGVILIAQLFGALHTTFCYGVTAAAPGTAATFIDANEASIRSFNKYDTALMRAIMVNAEVPDREDYFRHRFEQDPAFETNDLLPLQENDNVSEMANIYFPTARVTGVGEDHYAQMVGGGGNVIVAGLLLKYGETIPGYDPNKKVIRKYYNGTSATTWTDIGTIDDLDPSKTYNVIGMKTMGAPGTVHYGIRLNMAEYGSKPGVIAGQEVMFPEGAATIDGDSNPTVESISAGAINVTAIIALQETGVQKPIHNNMTPQVPNTGRNGGGIFSLFGGR